MATQRLKIKDSVSNALVQDGALKVKLVGGTSYSEVDTFDDLPAAADHSGEIYVVKTGTGVYLVNRKSAGLYLSNGTSWSRLGNIPAYFSDANFKVYNDSDSTKKIAIDVSGVTTGNTRTMTVPDNDFTPASLTDVGEQEFLGDIRVSGHFTATDVETIFFKGESLWHLVGATTSANGVILADGVQTAQGASVSIDVDKVNEKITFRQDAASYTGLSFTGLLNCHYAWMRFKHTSAAGKGGQLEWNFFENISGDRCFLYFKFDDNSNADCNSIEYGTQNNYGSTITDATYDLTAGGSFGLLTLNTEYECIIKVAKNAIATEANVTVYIRDINPGTQNSGDWFNVPTQTIDLTRSSGDGEKIAPIGKTALFWAGATGSPSGVDPSRMEVHFLQIWNCLKFMEITNPLPT
jgi:hypothetical protein